MQFLHQMFNVSALLLDNALKPATPLTNSAINEMLQYSLPLLVKTNAPCSAASLR